MNGKMLHTHTDIETTALYDHLTHDSVHWEVAEHPLPSNSTVTRFPCLYTYRTGENAATAVMSVPYSE